MNIPTIKQDLLRVRTLLNSGNKEVLENMLETFIKEYRDMLYSRLSRLDKDKWDNMMF